MVVTRPRAVTEISVVLLLDAVILAFPGISYVVMLFVNTGYPPTLFCVAGALLLPSLALAIIAIQFFRLKTWTYPIARGMIGKGWHSGPGSMFGFREKIKSAAVRQAFDLPPIAEDTPRSKVETRH